MNRREKRRIERPVALFQFYTRWCLSVDPTSAK